MEQLQLLERHLLAGELAKVSTAIQKLIEQREFDLLYDAASLFVDYGFLEQADTIYAAPAL